MARELAHELVALASLGLRLSADLELGTEVSIVDSLRAGKEELRGVPVLEDNGVPSKHRLAIAKKALGRAVLATKGLARFPNGGGVGLPAHVNHLLIGYLGKLAVILHDRAQVHAVLEHISALVDQQRLVAHEVERLAEVQHIVRLILIR